MAMEQQISHRTSVAAHLTTTMRPSRRPSARMVWIMTVTASSTCRTRDARALRTTMSSTPRSEPISRSANPLPLRSIAATNHGPATATNVNVNDVIPQGLTFNPSQSDQNCAQNGASVICNNTSLTANQSRSFTVAFTVSQTFTCGGTVQNAASVSHSSTDPNPANNQSAVVSTTVNCPVPPQCSDGVDNDNDGATDFPNDFSCSSPPANDETFPKAQCQDGLDNDGDGLVDLQDPGCHTDGNA